MCGGTGITAQYGTFLEAGNASNGISLMIQRKNKKANTYKYKKCKMVSNFKKGIEKEIKKIKKYYLWNKERKIVRKNERMEERKKERKKEWKKRKKGTSVEIERSRKKKK